MIPELNSENIHSPNAQENKGTTGESNPLESLRHYSPSYVIPVTDKEVIREMAMLTSQTVRSLV